MILINQAQSDKEPKLLSIVSESMPHLKRGAMRDFLDIMKTHGYYNEEDWNRTDSIYTFETGTKFEFFGADQPDKLRGARRDRLYINEANNVSVNAFNELEVRTRETVWLDWNPTFEFWFYTEVQPNEDMDVDFITLTYKDNEALDEATVKSIESRRNNVQWWRVYGEGKLGEHEDRVFKGWEILDELPHQARLEKIGLDFGYTNDPTAIVGIYRYNDGFILDEILYQKGMSNKQIADYLKTLENITIVMADSAEPKSIDEIRSYGVPITGATKGAGSINQGIQAIQDKKISVTKRSTSLIKEYRNYLWAKDREGNALNKPEDMFNHCMDAIRYGFNAVQQKRSGGVHKPKDMLRRKYK